MAQFSATSSESALPPYEDGSRPGTSRICRPVTATASITKTSRRCKHQTWSAYNIFAFWMSDVHSVGGYVFAGSLFALGLTSWQVLIVAAWSASRS